MSLFVACDLGTVFIKAAVASGDIAFSPSPTRLRPVSGDFGGLRVFAATPARVQGSPLGALKALLHSLRAETGGGFTLALTGTGAGPIAKSIGALYIPPPKALSKGIGALHPEAVGVVEIGGEKSRFLAVETEKGETYITDYDSNGDCAAGTGSFIEQQAARLLFENKRVGEIPKKP
ncbi:hypothetical protein FDZ71_05265, partial [bacterium]